MEKTVKFRLVEVYRPYTDPLDGEEKRASRLVSHGQKVSSEDKRDTETTIYNVPEDEIKRLDVVHPGWAFSDQELKMMEAGVTDDFTVRESLDSSVRGDTGSSQAFSPGDTDASPTSVRGGGGEAHPLTLGEMLPWQIEEYMRNEKPSPDDLLQAVDEAGPDGLRLARAFLDAETAITGGDLREELTSGITERFGFSAVGPEGSEGVPGTVPEEDDTSGASSTGGEGNGSAEPTESAAEYARENNVDLSQVQGTGAGGRVTRPDVEKYVRENQ
jgi:pyruvate/2-oxoglutarate dehydrogenase complex dihydrolipoamide acyltransferase (E2) component